MEEKSFKAAYVAAFLGGYAAVGYDENCQRGWPTDQQPVEDAETLAKDAWEQWKERCI